MHHHNRLLVYHYHFKSHILRFVTRFVTLAMVMHYEYVTGYILFVLVTNYRSLKSNLNHITALQKVARYITHVHYKSKALFPTLHTYIHTYIHKYVHTCVHTYIHT